MRVSAKCQPSEASRLKSARDCVSATCMSRPLFFFFPHEFADIKIERRTSTRFKVPLITCQGLINHIIVDISK